MRVTFITSLGKYHWILRISPQLTVHKASCGIFLNIGWLFWGISIKIDETSIK